MKKNFRNSILVPFALAGCLLVSGCSQGVAVNGTGNQDAGKDTAENQSQNVGEHEEYESFSEFADDLFFEMLGDETLSIHYLIAYPENYGLDNSTAVWGEIDESEEAQMEYSESLNEVMEILESFDYDSLSEEERISYDVIKSYIETELSADDLVYYYEPLGANSGFQAQLPVLLAEYSFYQEQDVINYISLCGQLPDYFQELLDYEKEKAEAELFMPDNVLEDVIEQCRSFLDGHAESFLYDTFETRLDDLNISDEKKQDYIAQNKEAVDNGVYIAYENLIEGLEELRGSGKYDGGLYYYPEGSRYYEYLIRSGVGTSKSAEELVDMVDEDITDYIVQMRKIYLSNPDIFDEYEDSEYPSSDPEEIMKQLIEICKTDFPQLSGVNYEIKYVDESLQEFLSPAFYLTPPVDVDTINEIYINGDDELTLSTIYPTIAHEGYPGHLYQENYFKEHNSSFIRQLLGTTGYAEGWATYVENMSYSLMPTLSEDVAELYKINSELTLALYAKMDLGIHAEGWDISEIQELINEYFGIDDIEVAEDVFYYILGDPAGYLDYYVGFAEINALRERAEKDSGFVLKEFHEELLNIGPAPFDIIEKYMFQ